VLEVEEMVADCFDVVIGVDTHRDAHALALLRTRDGIVLAERELPATGAGYRAAFRLARRAGARRAWALEGTGCSGAGLARFLCARGERVYELERPAREGSRRRLKSDALDAVRAARAALAGHALAVPRAPGDREALRVLLQAREGAVAIRRAGLNQLHALIVSAPEQLRERLRGHGRAALVASCKRLRPHPRQPPELYATALALRTIARRIEQATREAATLTDELERIVGGLAPHLLALDGVGPISAAQILVSWSHRGRFRSEGAFARLAGAPPIPPSSGKVVRHRLDRGGDRRLNRALHAIALSRRRTDAETQTYIARRVAEGKSEREAMRCLKRYLARSLFRTLEAMPHQT
jgi:transposase